MLVKVRTSYWLIAMWGVYWEVGQWECFAMSQTMAAVRR